MTRLLLTGGTGFIGRHLVPLLSGTDLETYVIVRRGSRRPFDDMGITLIECDLSDQEQVRRVVSAVRPDTAIHLAWHVEPGGWRSDTRAQLTSLEAGVRLLKELLVNGCARVVLAGSGVERLDGAQWHQVRPETPYAAAKEGLHRVAAHLAAQGIAIVCTHVYYLFGPGEDPRRLVPMVVNHLLRGETADVTDGQQQRDFLYVEDVASALLAVSASEIRGTVDLCSGVPTSLAALFTALATETGRPELLRLGAHPYAPDELVYHVGDASALQDLGWRPAYDLAGAARATVDWWRSRQHVEAR